MDKEHLIKKWLNDDLTASEKEAFSLLDDSQFNKEILDGAKHFKASHFSDVHSFETFKQRYEASNTAARKLNWFAPLLRIASVVVIALTLYFTLFYNNLTQIQTLASHKTTIELPDHSKVTLNALSEVAYNSKNWKDKREINLKGEAYFKVAKGETFDVITSSGVVTVVGTEFNVKQRDNYFEVKCFEGIVRVSSDTITRQLVAGETYQILNGIFIQDKTTFHEPQWTKNMSRFKAISFKEVIAELERQYDVEVRFVDVAANRTFTGGFVHDNIKTALISVTQPMGLTYEISTSNQVVIHGHKK